MSWVTTMTVVIQAIYLGILLVFLITRIPPYGLIIYKAEKKQGNCANVFERVSENWLLVELIFHQ